jgi:hypothetical protein
MLEGFEYKLFTKEEKDAFGFFDAAEIGVLIETARNRIVCMETLDITRRGQWCNSCNFKCAVGYVVWTHKDMRLQGLLSELTRLMYADLGVEYGRVYVDPRETLSEDEAAFFSVRELRLTPGFQWTPGTRTSDNVKKTEAWVERISAALGYDL